MVLLMASLFWALWDEAFGQRPWKDYQHEWKDRYSTFLKNARSTSAQSEKDIEGNSDYQKLKQDYDQANQQAAPRTKEISDQLRALSAKILAVQNVFTDRRAYVNALTYDIETTTSASSKQSKLKDLEKYKQQTAVVEYPDGSKPSYTYPQLEETYNELRAERGKLSAELGEVIKPVSEQKTKLDAYISEHMVNLTPAQIRGLEDKTEAWDPVIMQINVADANIVDRCESCHMGIREPVKLTPALMVPK